MKLIEKIKNHYKNKSKFAIISDVIFYALIISLIFPASRNFVIAHLQRLVMLPPRVEKKAKYLSAQDYQWVVVNDQGQQIALERFKGKVLVINFWATWCAPCLAELPALQRLYLHYKNNPNVAFLFITDEDLSKAQAFLHKKGFSLPVYKMIYRQPKPLLSNTIPSTYIIAPDGRIVAEAHRATRWDSKKTFRLIDNLLNHSSNR
jgi:thiol-disulfide isomerase/thioredoxin